MTPDPVIAGYEATTTLVQTACFVGLLVCAVVVVIACVLDRRRVDRMLEDARRAGREDSDRRHRESRAPGETSGEDTVP